MSAFSEYFKRVRERKQMQQDYEDKKRVVNSSEEKQLSHNERELVKVLKAEKEKLIREALYWEEQRRIAEEKLRARDMMKFKGSMFHNDSLLKQNINFLRGDESIW